MHAQLDFKEHARIRALWGGSAVISTHEGWRWLDGAWHKTLMNYGDAMLNCLDEIIVNMVDHWVRSVDEPLSRGGPVRNMWIDVDANGNMTFRNDGPGIPIVDKWKGQTKPGWLPGAIMTEERLGSNFDDVDVDRITGGLNGLGIKVSNTACEMFEIE